MTTFDEHLQTGDPGDPGDVPEWTDAELNDAADLAAENAYAEQHRPADWDQGSSIDTEPEQSPAPRLPEPFVGEFGVLDVDRLRALAPIMRDGLIGSLRHSATQLRAERGNVVVPEDTFDLVRRVTAAEEVLRQYAQAFTAAAAECVAICEEEALTANGPYPGVEEAPSGSLFVPDGEGQRIKVSPEWKPGESTWDVPTLIAWLIDDEVANLNGERRAEARRQREARQAAADPNGEGIEPEPLDDVNRAAELLYFEVDVRSVAAEVVHRMLSLGRYTPGAKALDELRKRLAEQQRDTDAAVIRQVRSVGPRRYVGVKVTREEA